MPSTPHSLVTTWLSLTLATMAIAFVPGCSEQVQVRSRESRPGCTGSSLECSETETRDEDMPVLHLVGRAIDTRSRP